MKLMIVDDDDQIREGMVFGIQWENLGIEQVEGRKNGKEVLEALEDTFFDIIISDISMPVMSGIDLMKLVHEKYPDIHFILISGYREFAYAQAGIQYGADAYILKPVHLDELLKIVSEVLDKIRRTREDHENRSYMKEINKNQRLRKLIHEREEDGRKITEFLTEECGMGRIHALMAFVLADDARSEVLDLNPSFRQYVVNLLTEYLAGYMYVFFLMDSNELFLLVELEDSTMLSMYLRQQLRKLLLEINHNAETGSFSIGVSELGYAANMVRLYETAKGALEERFFFGNGIFAEAEAHIKRQGRSLETEEKEWTGRMIRAIEGLDEISLKLVLAECKKQMCTVSREEVQRFLMWNTTEIFRKFDVRFEDHDLQRAILEAGQYESLISGWTQTLFGLLGERTEDAGYSREIRQAVRHIRQHYMERITVEQMAESLGISAGHFSRTFKQQVGTSFIKYLNAYRIKKAQELLAGTNLRIYEVAEQVGFSDYMYFTQVFRNITGKSPTELRK